MNDYFRKVKRVNVKVLAVILFVLPWQGGLAATINAASASQSDVASAVSNAQNGDTVLLPANKSATWTSALTVNKGITLDFGGCTITRSMPSTNEQMIKVTTVSAAPTRLTGGTFAGGDSGTGYNGRYMVISPGAGPFRLDHCTFQTAPIAVDVNNGKGLIDHCIFNAAGVCEIIHALGYGYNSDAGWRVDVTPGSDDMLFVEDCTFNKQFTGNAGALHAIANFYGHRTVFRHNTINGGMDFDAHGTAGNIGTRWYECYDNDWFVNCNLDKVFQLRAGSGAIFNNVLHNQAGANGGRTITVWEEDPGPYPALYQIGQGKLTSLDPLYIWNNTVVDAGGGNSGMQINNVTSSLIQLNRDYYTKAKSGYTPYVYPHPLQGGGGGPTPSPSPTSTPSPTATPIPSPTPTPTATPPSTKFSVGDWVAPSPNVANVRESAAGNLLGTQAIGAPGQITSGPMWGQLSGAANGVFWWQIDFETGVDGWVGEDNLISTSAPAPSPTPPQPTPSPSVSPSPNPSPTFEHWISDLNTWIRQNPPYEDPPTRRGQH